MTALNQAGDSCAAITSKPHAISSGSFRPWKTAALCAWGIGAVLSFHLAHEYFPPFILGFLVCMYQLAHARTRPFAMCAGWLVGLLIYGPQLAFFWTIFGAGAIALWLVLGTWLSLYLILQRFALVRCGPRVAALMAPLLWTGLEYFRSELYCLRFSWLSVGYTFSDHPQEALVPWLGMYGTGFVLMLLAAHLPFRRKAPRRQKWIWTAGLSVLVVSGSLFESGSRPGTGSKSAELRVAGVQLEFAEEDRILAELDRLLRRFPETQLFVLSEYTFAGPVPSRVKEWCARNRKHLVAGGKDFADASETQFRNTAFVIGPEGKEVFSQVKKVPIQFFKDGLPASEQNVWDSPWGKLGFCVCYDLSYTRVTDELIRRGAQAIIAPTMDVEEWGERQHRLHARVAPVRAAEYGVPIFRICSSGISQAVNANGAVFGTAPFPGQGIPLAATLKLPSRGTLPPGRVMVWPCVAVCAGLSLWYLLASLRSKRQRRHGA